MAVSSRIALCAEVGATNFRLGAFELASGSPHLIQKAVIPIAGAASLIDLLERASSEGDFHQQLSTADIFVIGAAGVARDNVIHHPPYPCSLDVGAAANRFGWRRFAVLNDAEAQAYYLLSTECLRRREWLVPGALSPSGGIGLCSVGTGLGQAAWIFRAGDKPVLLRSEGGNCPLPFYDPSRQYRFFGFLEAVSQMGVSDEDKTDARLSVRTETVISGSGLALCHRFVAEQVVRPIDMPQLVKEGKAEPTADFWAFYLGLAVNAQILSQFTTAGVYLYGGVLLRNPELVYQNRQTRAAFLEGLYFPSTHRELVKRVPIYLLTDEEAGLIGTAQAAAALLT